MEEKYIYRCLQLARLGEYYVAPNPMVGAVLVYHSKEQDIIMGEGWHERYGELHAEPNCIRNAQKNHPEGIDYKSCTLYVNLEPCSHFGKTPPCAELIIRTGIGRVVIGMLDPNPQVAGRGVKMLQDAGIQVQVGVLEKECQQLNKRFVCLHTQKRPYVILKWAQTADGFIDIIRENGSPLIISTPLTKQLVHQQRAENMAIMVGTRTALLDNPKLLNTRWSGRNPIRITLDRHHILPKDSNLFSNDAPTIVYTENTEWTYILSDLAKRNVHSILVEGGAILLQHIIDSGLYDEVHIEISQRKLLTPEQTNTHIGVKAPIYTIKSEPKTIDGNLIYCEKNNIIEP